MPLPPTFKELCDVEEGKIHNVIGVVIDCLSPLKTRTGDSMITFSIDDGSMQRGVKCRLFSRQEKDLPQINGLGDVVILKNVRYAKAGGQLMLLSVSRSGVPCPCAVLTTPIPKDWGIAGPKYVKNVAMKEVTEDELRYAMSISETQDKSKFIELREETKLKLQTITGRPKICPIKDLILGTYVNIVGEVVKIHPSFQRSTIYVTDYTENNLLYSYGGKQTDPEQKTQWEGPPGRYTLAIDCWNFTTNEFIRSELAVGKIVMVSNVRIVLNRDGQGLIEGKIHDDQKSLSDDRLRVKILNRSEAPEVLVRKEELGWANSFDPVETETKKRKAGDGKPTKNKRKRDQKKLAATARTEALAQEKAQASKNIPHSEAVVETSPPKAPSISLNESIRCEKRDRPIKSIPEIYGIEQTLKGKKVERTSDELVSCAIVRVVDFKPFELERFARAREMTDEEIREAEEAESSQSTDEDSEAEHSDTSIYNKSTQRRRRKWEWNFALLLQDASLPEDASKEEQDHNQIIVYIQGADGEYLLGEKALDLENNPLTLHAIREKLFLLWGDLEERKQKDKEHREARALANASGNISSGTSSSANSSQSWPLGSLPFRALIEEYGVEFRGQIQRRFKITGTTIVQGISPVKASQQTQNVTEDWNAISESDIDSSGSGSKVAETPCPPQLQNFRAPKA